MQTPNILFLMTDQQRWDAMGCAGNRRLATPNLDTLAGSSVRFLNAVTPTPVCVAARMSLITGQRASCTHWVANHRLPGPTPEFPTIMTLLQRAGYWTQGVGKMHFSGRMHGLRKLLSMEEVPAHLVDDDYRRYLLDHGVRTRFPQGLRDLLFFQPQTCSIPVEHSQNTWVADRSIEFLREHKRYRGEAPFFLWSSWIAPHPPFAPCEPYASRYAPEALPLPVNTERSLESLPSCHWGSRGRLDGAHRDPDRMRRLKALYYGQISHVDDAIGRVMGELEQLGLADNTAVFFMSDHGEMMGDHGLSQKNCPYEASVRIPLLLRWPGKTAVGTVCDDPVDLTDILPTLVEELHLPYDDPYCGPLPGASLLGKPGGGLKEARECSMLDYNSGEKRWIAARSDRYKYALYAADDGYEELFDLHDDPNEMRNVATDLPELAARFRERALAWERDCGLAESFEAGRWRTWPRPAETPTEESCRKVHLNEGPAPKRLPAEEQGRIETYAEAFTKAISKEHSLSPEKLSLKRYKEGLRKKAPEKTGSESLEGTPWEEAFRNA